MKRCIPIAEESTGNHATWAAEQQKNNGVEKVGYKEPIQGQGIIEGFCNRSHWAAGV